MIDLHSHSHVSDGEHAPAEVLRRAAEAKVTVLALTDHDTVAGLGEADVAAKQLGLTLVPGIEISAELNRREVHVLGHFIRPDDAALTGRLDEARAKRRTRMQEMVARLNGLGLPVQMADVDRIAGNAQLCRPHLARALLERGLVTSVQQAFERYLADDKPGHVTREKISAAEAVALIRGAGGTAAIAHPGLSKVNRLELEELRAAGLDGLEVYHSDHPPSMRDKLLGISAELGLVPTAGSDFHGELVAPHRKLGTAQTKTDDFRALFARASSQLLLGAPLSLG